MPSVWHEVLLEELIFSAFLIVAEVTRLDEDGRRVEAFILGRENTKTNHRREFLSAKCKTFDLLNTHTQLLLLLSHDALEGPELLNGFSGNATFVLECCEITL